MPDAQSMIERGSVAALAELRRQNEEGGIDAPYVFDADDLKCIGVDGRIDLVAVTRAVLTAMREPSGEHLEAGGKTLWAGSRDRADAKALEVWQAMIDAALEDGR